MWPPPPTDLSVPPPPLPKIVTPADYDEYLSHNLLARAGPPYIMDMLPSQHSGGKAHIKLHHRDTLPVLVELKTKLDRGKYEEVFKGFITNEGPHKGKRVAMQCVPYVRM